MRICNFYLQTFSSALTWLKPLVPSFISCIRHISENIFSALLHCLTGTRMTRVVPLFAAWMDGGPRSLQGALPNEDVSALMLGCLGKVPGLIPTASHITKDLIPNAEVANGRRCHFNCTWNYGFEPERKSEDSGELESYPRPFAQRLKIQLLFILNIMQILTPKHAPKRNRKRKKRNEGKKK